MMCGGPSEVQNATDDIQEIVISVRPDVEAKAEGRNFAEFRATHYRSQVVAGINYFIKVSLGADNYAHLRVFQPLPHTGEKVSLVKVLFDKKAEDTIEYI